jgi:aminoglycoside phosphotransferase (APT) family kinase protein
MPQQKTDAKVSEIEQAVKLSGLDGFTGKYTELGGGEVNETFILDCGNREIILRITKYSDVNNLNQEAKALNLLSISQVPKLIYFNENQRINNRGWILESFVKGKQAGSLTLKQFENFGQLLAEVHKVKSQNPVELDFWANFLDDSQHFGDEQSLLNHPDTKLNNLIRKAHEYFQSQPPYSITPSLVHGDVTLSNMLVDGNNVALIDWEFSKFKDPLADFSTMFYEDMEYNKGRWRIQIKDVERDALFAGYTEAGGVIDEQRLKVWLNLDKLGAAVYLYWKMYQSGHEISPETITQYKIDLENLTSSLEYNLRAYA